MTRRSKRLSTASKQKQKQKQKRGRNQQPAPLPFEFTGEEAILAERAAAERPTPRRQKRSIFSLSSPNAATTANPTNASPPASPSTSLPSAPPLPPPSSQSPPPANTLTPLSPSTPPPSTPPSKRPRTSTASTARKDTKSKSITSNQTDTAPTTQTDTGSPSKKPPAEVNKESMSTSVPNNLTVKKTLRKSSKQSTTISKKTTAAPAIDSSLRRSRRARKPSFRVSLASQSNDEPPIAFSSRSNSRARSARSKRSANPTTPTSTQKSNITDRTDEDVAEEEKEEKEEESDQRVDESTLNAFTRTDDADLVSRLAMSPVDVKPPPLPPPPPPPPPPLPPSLPPSPSENEQSDQNEQNKIEGQTDEKDQPKKIEVKDQQEIDQKKLQPRTSRPTPATGTSKSSKDNKQGDTVKKESPKNTSAPTGNICSKTKPESDLANKISRPEKSTEEVKQTNESKNQGEKDAKGSGRTAGIATPKEEEKAEKPEKKDNSQPSASSKGTAPTTFPSVKADTVKKKVVPADDKEIEVTNEKTKPLENKNNENTSTKTPSSESIQSAPASKDKSSGSKDNDVKSSKPSSPKKTQMEVPSHEQTFSQSFPSTIDTKHSNTKKERSNEPTTKRSRPSAQTLETKKEIITASKTANDKAGVSRGTSVTDRTGSVLKLSVPSGNTGLPKNSVDKAAEIKSGIKIDSSRDNVTPKKEGPGSTHPRAVSSSITSSGSPKNKNDSNIASDIPVISPENAQPRDENIENPKMKNSVKPLPVVNKQERTSVKSSLSTSSSVPSSSEEQSIQPSNSSEDQNINEKRKQPLDTNSVSAGRPPTGAKRVRFAEPSQPLRTSGKNVRLLQLMRRRHQRSVRKAIPVISSLPERVSRSVRKTSSSTISISGPDKLRQQELVDELQYLLDGIFKDDITTFNAKSKSNDRGAVNNNLIVSSLHSLVRLFLRKDGRATSDISTTGDNNGAINPSDGNSILGSNKESNGFSSSGGNTAGVFNDIYRDRGVVIDMLSAQPDLLSKIMKRLCTMLGKTSCIDALVALLFVITLRSAGSSLLVSEHEVESLLNIFVKNCAFCLKEEELRGRNRTNSKPLSSTGYERKDGLQNPQNANNPTSSRKRGLFARKNDDARDAKKSLGTLNELVHLAGVIEEDANVTGNNGTANELERNVVPLFSNEAEGAAYLLSSSLALVLGSLVEVREWMRNNRRLDRVVAAIYSSEALRTKWENGKPIPTGNDEGESNQTSTFNTSESASSRLLKARDRSGWRIVIAGSLKILQLAALDEVCQARLTTQTRVVSICVSVVRCMGSVRIGNGLDSEWVICNALKLCINLMRGSDENRLSQFVKVDGVQVILDCLVSECIPSKLVVDGLTRGKGRKVENANEEAYRKEVLKETGSEKKNDEFDCEESFDVRVLCLALLASAVDSDNAVCEAFPSMKPKGCKDENLGAFNIALEILTRSGDEDHSQGCDKEGTDDIGKDVTDSGSTDGKKNVSETNKKTTERIGEKCFSPTSASNNMERKITIGYVCLLIGALVRKNAKNRALLVERLSENGLLRIAEVLQEFLDFHHDVGVLSSSIDEMYEGIITSLRKGVVKAKEDVDIKVGEMSNIPSSGKKLTEETPNSTDKMKEMQVPKQKSDKKVETEFTMPDSDEKGIDLETDLKLQSNAKEGEVPPSQNKKEKETKNGEVKGGSREPSGEDARKGISTVESQSAREGESESQDVNDELVMKDVLGDMGEVSPMDDLMEIDEVLGEHLPEFSDEKGRVC